MALVGNTISNIFDNAAPAPQQSIFGGVGGWQNRLIAAGMGLLSGDDWQSQLRGGFGGYLQGAQQDKADKKERDLEAAVKGVTSDAQFMQGIPDSIAPLLTAKPELLGSIIESRLKPPKATEWSKLDDNTLYRQDTGETMDVGPEPGANPASVSNIITMRKELGSQPGTTRYRESAPILSSMINNVDDTSAMSDLDFVYGMAKIYDPTSVVRESEMGLVIEGQSVPASIAGLFNKLARGEQVLQPQLRRDLIKSAGVRVGEYRKQAESESTDYSGIAERAGINPQDIARPLEPMPQMAAPTFDDEMSIPEGATVRNEKGQLLMKRNGQLVPVQ